MCATARKPVEGDPAAWPTALAARLRASPPPGLCVGFSGGPDSTALLHALAQAPEARACRLRALHIDHGLHPGSRAWAAHCAAFCRTLDVPLAVVRVDARDTRGEGVEAAARRARHAAFADALGEGEWLAFAHHRDDQVETVLLKLLRGAGPDGLGGMRSRRPFARGFLWRPLLETPREAIHKYLIEKGLESIEDPANADPRFARNRVRDELLPHLEALFPDADAGILHAAELCRAASAYLDRATATASADVRRDDGTLDAAGWLALPDALRAPVLDRWLRDCSLPVPTDAQRQELERQVREAAPDRLPCVTWPRAEVRLWDGRLHALPPFPAVPAGWESSWDGRPLALPAGCGRLLLERAGDAAPGRPGPLQPPLTIRLRRGGERLRPAGDVHTRELRDLFQQARVPPWLRGRCPLAYAGGELVAVADLWASEAGRNRFSAHGARPRWQRPTPTPASPDPARADRAPPFSRSGRRHSGRRR